MAAPKKPQPKDYHTLPLETIITVVATKGETVIIKDMTFGEALKIDKSAGWIYSNYQKGFCAMVATKNNLP